MKESVIHWDIISYYEYLPLTFIYNDIKGEKPETYSENALKHIWFVNYDGKNVIKTTAGTAILYSPFFAIACFLAKLLGYPVDGYSLPFVYLLQFSSFFYLFIGAVFLNRFLKNFYSDFACGLTVLVTFLATNIVLNATIEACMSHIYTFCLITLFLNLTYTYYNKKQSLRLAFCLGIIGGLISLIRPTNILIWLVFILYGINNIYSLKERLLLFIRKSSHAVTFIISILLVWSPQFLYWKITTGKYLFFSYGEERFFFTNPHIISGFFGFRKGWLVYTPVMMFAIIGLFLIKKTNPFRVGSIVLFFVGSYIILSWWCWWYGGGFGNRAFIDMYPVLALGLAATLERIKSSKLLFNVPAAMIAILFCAYNIFQHFQYYYGSIHYDSMTRQAYFENFGEMRPKRSLPYQLEPIDYERALRGEN